MHTGAPATLRTPAKVAKPATGYSRHLQRVGTLATVAMPTTLGNQRPNPKEKHGEWEHIEVDYITSPYVHSNTCNMGNPLPESTVTHILESTFFASQELRILPLEWQM